ncbi:hypothetical protein [Streptacidiphilus jiangxiensis]|uniref:Uncharacterized protein n=1 Tax=Streptacidiphilus jiangxiensis TaxID=235985 RepID=A0A1H7U5E6_STRJI|nr:hypothetical protein [Streptacidiphilus jiangxiensis]SEL91477.1 hypothetical protein SAMN05414137_11554 [Streptacidiphilus jiangxiensis]
MGEFGAPVGVHQEEGHSPALDELLPLPARSRLVVWCQFLAQWFYLPIGSVIALIVIVFLVVSGGDADIPAGQEKIFVDVRLRRGLVLGWNRCRLERVGTPEEWAAHTERRLHEVLRRLAKKEAKEARLMKDRPVGSRPRVVALAAANYRGAGIGVVAQLAAPLGWSVDWPATRAAELRTVYLRRPADQVSAQALR